MPSVRNLAVAGASFRVHGLLAVICIMVAAAQTVSAQTETVLYSFRGGEDGASSALGNLVMDKQGNLYGTTPSGGIANSSCTSGSCGTVFKVSPAGKEKVLYRFTGGADGASPQAGLVIDQAGNLYGTTFAGGIQNCAGKGCGTVFKVSPAGQETVLYSFTGGDDGGLPIGGLVMDKTGNLYGTTEDSAPLTFGTVFKLTPSGTETVLHTFTGGSDGVSPSYGNLLMDTRGNLYGTTQAGGSSQGGTVFRVTPSGTETVLYAFKGGADGKLPFGSLAMDKQGRIYGTTSLGGMPCGCGTVYRLTPSGTETVLYTFQGGADGLGPLGGVVLDSAGNLYGTTEFGGSTTCTPVTCGTVFKVSTSRTETVLHSFVLNGSDGIIPFSGLLMDKQGNFYGTTADGGTGTGAACPAGCGSVYKVTP
jgi:uncharacterized repeat protein (TIGR03803 family)